MYMIEGSDDVDINNNLSLNPSLESIQEFQVLGGTYSARIWQIGRRHRDRQIEVW